MRKGWVLGVLTPILLQTPVRAYDIQFFLREPDGTPIASQVVSIVTEFTFNLVASTVTDAIGNGRIVAAGGPGGCFQIIRNGFQITTSPPGMTYSPRSDLLCGNIDFTPNWQFIGTRNGPVAGVHIFGGAKGYIRPSAGEVAAIVFRPPSGGIVSLKIYTMGGRLLYSQQRHAVVGVPNTFTWDCRDPEGRLVVSGIYIAHIVGGGHDAIRKFAIVAE